MTDTTTTSSDHAELVQRFNASNAAVQRLKTRSPRNSEFIQRTLPAYHHLRKVDPAVIKERMRRIHAIAGGEEDVKVVAKKVRPSRALPTKAAIRRLVAAALEAGLDVRGIQPDGTVLTTGSHPELITIRPPDTDDLDRELADFEARHG